jgi:hypothetical protein
VIEEHDFERIQIQTRAQTPGAFHAAEAAANDNDSPFFHAGHSMQFRRSGQPNRPPSSSQVKIRLVSRENL